MKGKTLFFSSNIIQLPMDKVVWPATLNDTQPQTWATVRFFSLDSTVSQ